MNIYKVGNNLDYVDLSFVAKEDVRLFSTFKGQHINVSWKEPLFKLSNDKLRTNELMDFDGRCYGSTLIIKKQFVDIFKDQLKDRIEIFPIEISDINNDFAYINLLNVRDAIDFNGSSNEDIMIAVRNNKIPFIFDIVKDSFLFRDSKLTFYYCTQAFVDFINNIGLKGLKFEKVGCAK